MSNYERRVLPLEDCELRIHGGEDGPGRLRGYAAVFDSRSRDLGGFREVIRPGAFDGLLEGRDVLALFNHDRDHLLGRQGNGTLRLSTDERGLRYEVELDETQISQFVRAKVERRDLIGSSFTFRVAEDGDHFITDGDQLVREVTRVDGLRDVGPVTEPAYEATEVSARSVEAAREELERLRERASGPELARADEARLLLG